MPYFNSDWCKSSCVIEQLEERERREPWKHMGNCSQRDVMASVNLPYWGSESFCIMWSEQFLLGYLLSFFFFVASSILHISCSLHFHFNVCCCHSPHHMIKKIEVDYLVMTGADLKTHAKLCIFALSHQSKVDTSVLGELTFLQLTLAFWLCCSVSASHCEIGKMHLLNCLTSAGKWTVNNLPWSVFRCYHERAIVLGRPSKYSVSQKRVKER